VQSKAAGQGQDETVRTVAARRDPGDPGAAGSRFPQGRVSFGSKSIPSAIMDYDKVSIEVKVKVSQAEP
jgi:hypothetical protein